MCYGTRTCKHKDGARKVVRHLASIEAIDKSRHVKTRCNPRFFLSTSYIFASYFIHKTAFTATNIFNKHIAFLDRGHYDAVALLFIQSVHLHQSKSVFDCRSLRYCRVSLVSLAESHIFHIKVQN